VLSIDYSNTKPSEWGIYLLKRDHSAQQSLLKANPGVKGLAQAMD